MGSLHTPEQQTLRPGFQRLGKNNGRYHGETIQIQSILREIQSVGLKQGWQRECFLENEAICLAGYYLPAREPRQRLYISAGIHGDEPAGPLAILQLLQEHRWPGSIEIWMCPCLNPSGFELNSRENRMGLDLNRQYLQPTAPEIRSHIAWLDRQPRFDVSLCLHEDWESNGFYVYELSLPGQPSFAEEIIRSVEEVCPIDRSPIIEGREAHQGIIRPNPDPASRPEWPEAFYLITQKTGVSCTLEAPSDFALEVRVAALVAGVGAVIAKMVQSQAG